jgi:hypothetical protein
MVGRSNDRIKMECEMTMGFQMNSAPDARPLGGLAPLWAVA